jgi:hypothetical protein
MDSVYIIPIKTTTRIPNYFPFIGFAVTTGVVFKTFGKNNFRRMAASMY